MFLRISDSFVIFSESDVVFRYFQNLHFLLLCAWLGTGLAFPDSCLAVTLVVVTVVAAATGGGSNPVAGGA